MRGFLAALLLAAWAAPACAVSYRLDAGITNCIGGDDCWQTVDPNMFDAEFRINKKAFSQSPSEPGRYEATFTVGRRYDLPWVPATGDAPLEYSRNWRWLKGGLPIPVEETLDVATFWLEVDDRYRPTRWYMSVVTGPPDYYVSHNWTEVNWDWYYFGPGGIMEKVKRTVPVAAFRGIPAPGDSTGAAPVPLPAGVWLMLVVAGWLVRPWRMLRRGRASGR